MATYSMHRCLFSCRRHLDIHLPLAHARGVMKMVRQVSPTAFSHVITVESRPYAPSHFQPKFCLTHKPSSYSDYYSNALIALKATCQLMTITTCSHKFTSMLLNLLEVHCIQLTSGLLTESTGSTGSRCRFRYFSEPYSHHRLVTWKSHDHSSSSALQPPTLDPEEDGDN